MCVFPLKRDHNSVVPQKLNCMKRIMYIVHLMVTQMEPPLFARNIAKTSLYMYVFGARQYLLRTFNCQLKTVVVVKIESKQHLDLF